MTVKRPTDPREEVIRHVLVSLSSPMLLMSRPYREELLEAVDKFQITVRDLISYRKGRG